MSVSHAVVGRTVNLNFFLSIRLNQALARKSCLRVDADSSQETTGNSFGRNRFPEPSGPVRVADASGTQRKRRTARRKLLLIFIIDVRYILLSWTSITGS